MIIHDIRGTIVALLLAAAALALSAGATPARAQEEDGDRDLPQVLVTAWSGFSMREGQATFRFADDLVTYGLRASLSRRPGARLWVQLDRFTRPDLVCSADVACNDDGVLLRVGGSLPFSADDRRPGFHPRLVAGVGAGFSEETELSYLLGIGAAWTLHPRFAPIFEARWERVPGLSNTVMLTGGLRVGIL